MFKRKKRNEKGFSLIELTVAMTIMLILLSVVSTLITRAMGVRQRETRRADALVSVQAALNVISREVANSGFGPVRSDDEPTCVSTPRHAGKCWSSLEILVSVALSCG